MHDLRGKCSLHLGVETTYGKDAAGNVEAVFNFVPSPGVLHLQHQQQQKKQLQELLQEEQGFT